MERVAAPFGTALLAIDKGVHQTEFIATVKGSRAVALMTDLRPHLGSRRRAAIERAIQGYHPPQRKLDFKLAEEIRARLQQGETAAKLARRYHVAHATIRQIRSRRVYDKPPGPTLATDCFRSSRGGPTGGDGEE